jgi:iron complex outermembrane receptor protein
MSQPQITIRIFGCLILGGACAANAQTPATQPASTRPASNSPTVSSPISVGASSADTGAGSSDLTSMSLEDLMNLQVTSVSKTPQKTADAAASVTVITQDDMQRSGFNEIPDMLRMAPGLFVQRGNQFTGWSVASRGFGALFSDKLLVLQDGVSLYTPLFSGVYWNTVDYPIADLDRIEVIRGPGATLWGANAVNGVINITSKSAMDTQGTLVETRVGEDSSDATARYGGQIDENTYYRVYGMGRAYAAADEAPSPAGTASQWDDTRAGFRIDHYSSTKDTITVQGDGFEQDASDELVTGHILPNYSHDYRSGETLLARWSHVDSDTSDYSLQTYYDYKSLRDGYATYDGNTFDVDYQQRFQVARVNELMYGLGAREMIDSVSSESLAQPVVDPASRDTHLFSAFVQDDLTVVPDRLHFIAGSKFEENGFTGFDVQPSGRLLWTPSQTTSLWGAVSRAVRTPSLLEWDDAVRIPVPLGNGQFGLLNKTSEHPNDEDLLAYEIGFRQQVAKVLSYDVTVFANKYNNLISLESTGTTIDPASTPSTLINSTYANAQNAQTYGTEFSTNLQASDKWRLAASYSFLEAYVQDTKPGLTPDAAAIAESTPRNQAQIRSYYDITRNLQFNSGLYYVENIGNGNVLQATGAAPGSYIRGDFNIVWSPTPGMDVSLGIQNAFQPHHLESSFNATASSEVDRAVYAQFEWKF